MKLFHIASILLVLTQLVYGQEATPTIVEITPKQIVQQGDTVTFTCILENVDNYTISWQTHDDTLSLDATCAKKDSRYTVLRTDHNDTDARTTYTLEIRDVQPDDAGTLICKIFDHENEVYPPLDVELEILVPQTISTNNIYSSRDQVKTVGDNVTMVCIAKNVRPDACIWRKSNTEPGFSGMITHNGRSLRPRFKSHYQTTPVFSCSFEISDVSISDEGVYQCALIFTPYELFVFNVHLSVHEDDIDETDSLI